MTAGAADSLVGRCLAGITGIAPFLPANLLWGAAFGAAARASGLDPIGAGQGDESEKTYLQAELASPGAQSRAAKVDTFLRTPGGAEQYRRYVQAGA